MINIEQRFLLKAMEDKNFVSFMYEAKSFKSVKILKFEDALFLQIVVVLRLGR